MFFGSYSDAKWLAQAILSHFRALTFQQCWRILLPALRISKFKITTIKVYSLMFWMICKKANIHHTDAQTGALPYLKILTPFNLPSWNKRIGGSPLKAVVSGLPHTTSSLSDGQPIKAKSPSSSNTRLFARFRCSRLENGIGGLYLSPGEIILFVSILRI